MSHSGFKTPHESVSDMVSHSDHDSLASSDEYALSANGSQANAQEPTTGVNSSSTVNVVSALPKPAQWKENTAFYPTEVEGVDITEIHKQYRGKDERSFTIRRTPNPSQKSRSMNGRSKFDLTSRSPACVGAKLKDDGIHSHSGSLTLGRSDVEFSCTLTTQSPSFKLSFNKGEKGIATLEVFPSDLQLRGPKHQRKVMDHSSGDTLKGRKQRFPFNDKKLTEAAKRGHLCELIFNLKPQAGHWTNVTPEELASFAEQRRNNSKVHINNLMGVLWQGGNVRVYQAIDPRVLVNETDASVQEDMYDYLFKLFHVNYHLGSFWWYKNAVKQVEKDSANPFQNLPVPRWLGKAWKCDFESEESIATEPVVSSWAEMRIRDVWPDSECLPLASQIAEWRELDSRNRIMGVSFGKKDEDQAVQTMTSKHQNEFFGLLGRTMSPHLVNDDSTTTRKLGV